MEILRSKLSTEDVFSLIKSNLQHSNFELLNYEFVPFTSKLGLLGDHYILKVSIRTSEVKQVTFFTKCFPSCALMAKFATATNVFRKEIFINRLFEGMKTFGIKIIEACTPRLHISEENCFLIFQNLEESDFRMADKHSTLNYQEILVVIKSLAKLHASSFIYEEKKSKELGEVYRIGDDFEDELEESFYRNEKDYVNYEGVIASIRSILKEVEIFQFPEKLNSGRSFKAVVEGCCYKLYDLVKRSKKFRNVVCHGDLWATNILLKCKEDAPTECMFVDFQVARYVPPSHDLMSVIHLTTSRELRKKHLYELVGIYYNHLEGHLKLAGCDVANVVKFSEFLESCEEQKLCALIMAATYFQLILLKREFLDELFSDEEFAHRAFYEDRSLLVVKYLDGDENYKRRLQESIQDLWEYCEYL